MGILLSQLVEDLEIVRELFEISCVPYSEFDFFFFFMN